MRFLAYLSCLVLSAVGATALAAGDPDAAKGLVAEHCVSCHEVPGYGGDPQLPSPAAVSFLTIAENPETYTQVRLKAYLQQPHWPMRQFQLSKSDIDNILALIESLAER
jgi:mono/diheme cytochrome c family protein